MSADDERLSAGWIDEEARVLHGITTRAPGRDAELAAEVTRLSRAVLDAARELDFDDQPGDFPATLMALRDDGSDVR
jgi:hypothetical protein